MLVNRARSSWEDDVDETARLERLLRQAQAGDRQALEVLLGWLRNKVRPWAQRQIGGDLMRKLDASDIAQEVCIRIHRAFDRLYEDCTLPQLLGLARTVLHNVVADCRRRRAHREVGGEGLFAGLAADTTPAEQRVLRGEREARLEQAIERLPEQQRRALRLRLRQGLTFQEIGRRMNISLSRARVLFLRAAERLRGELGEG
jgi:RNA polymerase sigma-70 factor (ECF subfamily)